MIAAWPGRLAAGFVVVLIAALASGCGGGGEAKQVSLAQLAEQQQSYDAEQISTSGWVLEERSRHGAPHFLLSDRHGNLVELEPAAKAAPHLGGRVEVSGRFEVAPGIGRVIEDSRISAPGAGG